MSNHTAIIGKIEVPHFLDWKLAAHINEKAIKKLPEIDSWPFLSQAMFATTPEGQSYYHIVYHFAATMKGIEEE